METHHDDRETKGGGEASSLVRYALKVLCGALLLFALISCSMCRETAVRDAEWYSAKGYPVRIATYDLQLDGLLYGAFLWKHHAQAQVYRHGNWYWVCELGGLCKEPTFRTKRMLVLWDVREYKSAIHTSLTSGVPAD